MPNSNSSSFNNSFPSIEDPHYSALPEAIMVSENQTFDVNELYRHYEDIKKENDAIKKLLV